MDRLTGRTTRHGGKKPKVLKGKDIPSLAKYIKSDGCKNIVLMVCRLSLTLSAVGWLTWIFMQLGAGKQAFSQGPEAQNCF